LLWYSTIINMSMHCNGRKIYIRRGRSA
jgi:hypothetical protein